MSFRDLIPFRGRRECRLPVRRAEAPAQTAAPFAGLSLFDRDFDSLVEDFFRDFDAPWFPNELARLPRLNVSETDQALVIEAEVPGLEEKDLDVSIENGVLRLRGEKRHEAKHEEGKVHRCETACGRFERAVQLPDYANVEATQASLKNGVLTVTVGKHPQKETGKRIPVNAG